VPLFITFRCPVPLCSCVLTAALLTASFRSALLLALGKHYDPCIDSETEAYLNRRDVQLALQRNVSGELPAPWKDCTQDIQYKRCAACCVCCAVPSSSALHSVRLLIGSSLLHTPFLQGMRCCAPAASAVHFACHHLPITPCAAGATCCAPSCRCTAS